MNDEWRADGQGTGPSGPKGYPTTFLFDRIRQSKRRRTVFWILLTLVVAGAAAFVVLRVI